VCTSIWSLPNHGDIQGYIWYLFNLIFDQHEIFEVFLENRGNMTIQSVCLAEVGSKVIDEKLYPGDGSFQREAMLRPQKVIKSARRIHDFFFFQ
jgi:hypothetical protein